MNELLEKELVIFDVETTGLSPQSGDRVIEIAAVKIKKLKVIDKFHSLVDPQREISFGAFQVNGISQEMLEGQPLAEDVFPRFLEFAGSRPLVGYNVGFDMGFLRNELMLIEKDLPPDIVTVDVLRMARKFLPNLKRYPMWHVAQCLNIEEPQQHRALADVMMTLEIFRKLTEHSEGKNPERSQI
ncbi:MAG: 3'-5' exonuclease [Candidatus Omnitrophota bacterium]